MLWPLSHDSGLVLGITDERLQISPALKGLQANEEWAHTVMTQPGAGCKGQAQGPWESGGMPGLSG